MSDNDSVFSEKSQDLNDRGDLQQLPRKYLYICSKCGYGTNKAGSMLGHAVRLRPCNVQLDENYILERARKIYDKLLDEIIDYDELHESIISDIKKQKIKLFQI
jgi:hypothetical protein